MNLRSSLREFGSRRGERGFLDVCQNDASALGDQCFRDRSTDSTRAARDDCDLAPEILHESS
jgi:hypothetical protein